MAKRKRHARIEKARIQPQSLSKEQMSINGEVNYIIQKAQESDARLVRLDNLVFFSTETGDAWLLDTEDNLALCLARDGDRQPFTITETAVKFAIEWNADYRIEGDRFIVAERSGRVRTILGYPTREILRARRGRGNPGE